MNAHALQLSRLAPSERIRVVEVLGLGVKTAHLVRGGFVTLGDVFDDAATGLGGIRRLPSFGTRSQGLVRQRLAVLHGCLDADGRVDWDAFFARCGSTPAAVTDHGEPCVAVRLTDDDLARDVADLHLGVRTARLLAGGYTTVRALVVERNGGFAGLADLPSFGARSITLIAQRLSALEACLDDGGSVDWPTFDRHWNGQPEEETAAVIPLAKDERSRPVDVLGLGPKGLRFAQGGFDTLGSIVDDAANGFAGIRRLPVLGLKLRSLLRQRLSAVESSTLPDGSVDWAGFAAQCELEAFLPGASGTARPAAPLADVDRARPVEALWLGVRARRLSDGGFATVGDLADDRRQGYAGIGRLPGFGDGAIALVRRRLAALDTCRTGDGAVDWSAFARLWGERAAPPPPPPDGRLALLSAAALARPIEVLRPGPKAGIIRNGGLRTLGDLLTPEGVRMLPRLTGLGERTTGLVEQRLGDLCASVDAAGEPDWDGVAAGWGLVVTPEGPTTDGETFVAALGEVVETVIASQRDEMDRLILSERLLRSRENRMTLEALGSATGVTRERIRQREKRLLDGLSDALLNDDQSDVPVHFREDFRAFWVRAAERFAVVTELGFRDFVAGLEAAWDVPAARLAPFLPLATSILADGVRLTHPRLGLDPRLLKPISPSVLTAPLQRFPTGRAREGLLAAGCASFGALVLAGFEDRLPEGRDGRVAVEVLNRVAAALTPSGDLDPQAYATALGVPLLPAAGPDDGSAFLAGLDVMLATAAQANATSGRAADIYRMRTSAPRRTRPTLDDVAAAFGGHGPTIKREESVMLAALHTQLVEHDFTDARVVYRPGVLSFFAEAHELCEASGHDYDRFCRAIARQWAVDPETLPGRAEGLWAVLTLYPGGRRSRAPVVHAVTAPADAEPAPTVITLRGFRRQH